MRTARAESTVVLDPASAAALWRDVRRWPSFVEGFARLEDVSADWPAPGARVVWVSTPGGRGRVTEKVVEADDHRLTTRIFEDALQGTQRAVFEDAPEGAHVRLELEYDLARFGPLRAVADVLFIRRALREALGRTLRRFAIEAQEERALR